MKNVAEFKKVPISEWTRSIKDNDLFEEIEYHYKGEYSFITSHKSIKLPKRSTKRSAGYDFFSPIEFTIQPHSSFFIPSGIRVKIYAEEYGLFLYPRSGLAKNHGIRLKDTVGVIDADYYDNKNNKGHIHIILHNPSDEAVSFNVGDKLCQGVFQEYGLVIGDSEYNEDLPYRDGGFGSTGK